MSPLLPDGDRDGYSAGIGFISKKGNWGFDVGYEYLSLGERSTEGQSYDGFDGTFHDGMRPPLRRQLQLQVLERSKPMKKLILTTCMVALLAAPAMAQVDFTRYVALGDSLTAGVASGSIMDYYQVRSYPAAAGHPGRWGSPSGAVHRPSGSAADPGTQEPEPALHRAHRHVCRPRIPFEYFYNLTLEAPYQNLGLSGANTNDLLTKTGNALNLVAGNFDNVVYDMTLRVPQQPDPNTGDLIDYTAMVAAIGQQPTFLTVWIGSNDVLGAVLAATPIDGVTMTPLEAFATDYATLIGGLAMSLPTTDIVIMNIFSDARWIPFSTTVPTSVDVPGVGTVPLMGEDGPLGPGDYLTLPAAELLGQGMGLPVPGIAAAAREPRPGDRRPGRDPSCGRDRRHQRASRRGQQHHRRRRRPVPQRPPLRHHSPVHGDRQRRLPDLRRYRTVQRIPHGRDLLL